MNTPPIAPATAGTSTRPYLVRALHEWCTDNGFTPYVAVFVDGSVRVPMEFVKNNEIVLNVGFEATNGLQLGNEFIEFKARFGGSSRDIRVPMNHVIAIYARENGQGMAFPAPSAAHDGPAAGAKTAGDTALSVLDAPAVRSAPRLTLTQTRSNRVDEPIDGDADRPEPPAPATPPAGGRPSLKRIK